MHCNLENIPLSTPTAYKVHLNVQTTANKFWKLFEKIKFILSHGYKEHPYLCSTFC